MISSFPHAEPAFCINRRDRSISATAPYLTSRGPLLLRGLLSLVYWITGTRAVFHKTVFAPSDCRRYFLSSAGRISLRDTYMDKKNITSMLIQICPFVQSSTAFNVTRNVKTRFSKPRTKLTDLRIDSFSLRCSAREREPVVANRHV